MRTKLKIVALALISCTTLGCVAGLLLSSCTRQQSSTLKPINQAALQSLVETTIKELLVPGAVVLLRTPQGDFTAASGTTQLNTRNPPLADTGGAAQDSGKSA